MPSHNLAKITIDDLDIIGYSIAGEETVIGMPQLDVCFDIGKAPDQIISINHLLLTHGHIDHAAGFAYYLSHRKFCGIGPGTVLAPKNLLKPMKDIARAWGKLDGNTIEADFIGVGPGDEHQIKPNLIVRVFPTKHTAGSVGYTVIEQRKKLRPEYTELTGPQIVELKKQGVEIDYPLELPIATYLGDTQYVDYSQLEYVAKSKILIAECTFYEDEHIGRAEAGKHMHINEFAKLVAELNNEHVVVMHTTQRTGMQDVRKVLKKALPKKDCERVKLLMAHRPRLVTPR